MVLNDPIADALSKINNSVKALKSQITLKKSKLLISLLGVLKENGYVGSYEIVDDGKQGKVNVNLLGRINKCGVIKPRYPVKIADIEKYEKKFIPAKGFGIIVLSTNKGLLTQGQAREQNVGGTLVAYCY
jgi:small subunit ribosomal protein S8